VELGRPRIWSRAKTEGQVRRSSTTGERHGLKPFILASRLSRKSDWHKAPGRYQCKPGQPLRLSLEVCRRHSGLSMQIPIFVSQPGLSWEPIVHFVSSDLILIFQRKASDSSLSPSPSPYRPTRSCRTNSCGTRLCTASTSVLILSSQRAKRPRMNLNLAWQLFSGQIWAHSAVGLPLDLQSERQRVYKLQHMAELGSLRSHFSA